MEPLPSKIDVPLIKATLPNYITARATITRIKQAEETAAAGEHRTARPCIYCQFCGRSYPSMQSLRAHLAHCRGKAQVLEAAREGIRFRVGGMRYRVRCRSIKFFAFLERVEAGFEKELKTGNDPEYLESVFMFTIRGAQESNGDGAILFDQEPITPRPPSPPPETATGAGAG